MFNTDDMVNKIIGQRNRSKRDLLDKVGSFEEGSRGFNKPFCDGKPIGRGLGPNFSGGFGKGFNNGFDQNDISSREIVTQLQDIMDKIPQVKKAKGNFTIELHNGKKMTLNLDYFQTTNGGF